MAKVKVATTAMTSCFGCHMSILDIDERLIDLLELVEFDKSPIDDIKEFSGPVDVGIIEGGVSNDENLEVIRYLNRLSDLLWLLLSSESTPPPVRGSWRLYRPEYIWPDPSGRNMQRCPLSVFRLI